MLKKQFSAKSVVIISFVVPLLGFLSEVYNRSNIYIIASLAGFVSSLNLSWLSLRNSISLGGNIFNWIFYCLMLFGAILLWLSKGKETRLPRAGFALIIFHKALFSIYALYVLLSGSFNERYDRSILFYLLYMLTRFVWIWLAWKVLAWFNQQKELETQTYTYGDQVTTSYVDASWNQRLMNFFIDGFMMILLFSLLIEVFIYSDMHNNPLMKLQSAVGEKVALVIIIAVCRLIYYVPFEVLTGATPAKYLTETYVINDAGERPGFAVVLKRTLARFIPFESFSFLLRANGWHDRISKTVVVKEKRTGASGGRYFMIIPLSLVLWGLTYWGYQEYGDYKNRQEYKNEQERIKGDMLDKFEKINTSDFLELKTLGSYAYGEAKVLLKVEKVSGELVTCSVIVINSDEQHANTEADIEKIYNEFKDKGVYKKASFAKQEMRDAIKPPGSNGPEEIKGLKVNDGFYYISSIDRYYEPNIKLSGRTSRGDHFIDVSLVNVGWPSDLTKIIAEEGDITFKTIVPLHLSPKGYGSSGFPFEIEGTMANGNDFKINLTIRDSIGREQIYRISGNCNEYNKTLTRLK